MLKIKFYEESLQVLKVNHMTKNNCLFFFGNSVQEIKQKIIFILVIFPVIAIKLILQSCLTFCTWPKMLERDRKLLEAQVKDLQVG
jgi:hypothetical protein